MYQIILKDATTDEIICSKCRSKILIAKHKLYALNLHKFERIHQLSQVQNPFKCRYVLVQDQTDS